MSNEDDKLNKKILKYYNKLSNPTLTIGDWNITDERELKKLNKITLTAISDIRLSKTEYIICAESKSKYIVFKYNPAFIASKEIDREYEYLLKDWNLIAVNKDYIYKGTTKASIEPKEILKIIGIKLNRKAKEDLESFV
jgi:hypothetical protein